MKIYAESCFSFTSEMEKMFATKLYFSGKTHGAENAFS